MPSTLAGDRLYGINLRPHELALHGEKVQFGLRYSPIFDDPTERTTHHFFLLVLEIHAEVALDDAAPPKRVQLLKCGWELERTTATDQTVGSVAEEPGDVPLLLKRIADTVNDLARRAGLEAPLGPSVVDQLLADYRAQTR
jgi:hypothetical protein